MSLMSLQGAINLAPRVNTSGVPRPGALRFVGQADACEIELSTDTAEQTESYTGQRLKIGSLTLGKSGSLTLTLKDWSPENLALGLYGKTVSVTTGTVSAEPLPGKLNIGDRIRLARPFVSDVVMMASGGGTELKPGVDFRVDSASAGIIALLTDQALTATVAYSYAATEQLGMFSSAPAECWLLLDGINTENDERALVQLYRVKFNPVSSLALLHNEGYGELPLTGEVLADTAQGSSSPLGYFGSYIRKVE